MYLVVRAYISVRRSAAEDQTLRVVSARRDLEAPELVRRACCLAPEQLCVLITKPRHLRELIRLDRKVGVLHLPVRTQTRTCTVEVIADAPARRAGIRHHVTGCAQRAVRRALAQTGVTDVICTGEAVVAVGVRHAVRARQVAHRQHGALCGIARVLARAQIHAVGAGRKHDQAVVARRIVGPGLDGRGDVGRIGPRWIRQQGGNRRRIIFVPGARSRIATEVVPTR